MDEKKLDSLITDTLVERAERLSVSPEVKQLVRQKISEEKKEKTNMKHRISGKIVILAAALCLLGTMGAVSYTHLDVYKRQAPIPATSPTLSPTLSAMTAGFRGSSSGIPASTLPTKSAPTSAALV